MNQQPTDPYDSLGIPSDFPRSMAFVSLPKGRDNRFYSFYKGKYYPLGSSPPESWIAWQICEELVHHFKKECQAVAVQCPLLPIDEIIRFYFQETLNQGWGTDAEIEWIFRHVAGAMNTASAHQD